MGNVSNKTIKKKAKEIAEILPYKYIIK